LFILASKPRAYYRATRLSHLDGTFIDLILLIRGRLHSEMRAMREAAVGGAWNTSVIFGV
jgi:hypothetical protein